MLKEWKKQIKNVQQVTKLNVGLFSCVLTDWENYRYTYEEAGNAVIQYFVEGDKVWFVGICVAEWSESARAMLPLLFPLQQRELTIQEMTITWLKKLWIGEESSPPPSLNQAWNWSEPRICFCIEQQKKQNNSLGQWRELFTSFFSSPTKFQLFSLSSTVHLLLLPASVLLEVSEKTENQRDIWKDWAYSIHDLLATEAAEETRILVSQPLDQPNEIAFSLHTFQILSKVLNQIIPNQIVAATWDYRLEQWVISLGEREKQQLLSTLSPRPLQPLSSEHIELLQAFFEMNLNSSETARKLYIHRNTLLYRLDKITEWTGLDPRIFHDAVILRLLLLTSTI